MYRAELLQEKIASSGLKLQHIAAQMGLSYQGLRNKITGENEFTASEIWSLASLVRLSGTDIQDIFFASDVEP